MTDKERVEAFMDRLAKDDELAPFALMLGPQLIFQDAKAIVRIIEKSMGHWQATAPQEIKQ